ncbi:MAG: hypothetical protein HY717_20880 [Planctomycetes bacterium]|nr:hypothetical protein [Planctomycetota bacterium]
MDAILMGFGLIFVAAVSGGAFGLQYRVQRLYTVENTALVSLFFATIVVPLVAVQIFLPGWMSAVVAAGPLAVFVVFAFGFGWGLGAITYAYGFNLLGMALGAALIKGITVAVGAGIPLIRRWGEVGQGAKAMTIVGIALLLIGTAISGRAGVLREREVASDPPPDRGNPERRGAAMARGREFALGMIWCLISGLLSACANLGYDYAEPLEKAAKDLGRLDLYATLIRWMPMYWGGITALAIFMGGAMIKNGTWRNYFAGGSLRDFAIASSMGFVHFLAQIPYGAGAFYLGKLGTTVGWGVNLGMALVVATALGFFTGEWKGASKAALKMLYAGLGVLFIAMGILAYANSLVS